jgi:hypothetical protein
MQLLQKGYTGLFGKFIAGMLFKLGVIVGIENINIDSRWNNLEVTGEVEIIIQAVLLFDLSSGARYDLIRVPEDFILNIDPLIDPITPVDLRIAHSFA